MASTVFGWKRLCGIAAVTLSLVLVVSFVLSEAWFGVMLALFTGVVGMQVVMKPDKLLRSGEDDVAEDFQSRFEKRD